jgi:hypothetical protein
MHTHAMNRRMLFLIFGGTAAFMAVVAVAVFWLLGKAEESTRHASTRFATALVKNDPSAAPAGGADYVTGVRAYFGPVRSAEVIDAHNKSINTGDSADTRSYFVADILLHTERGAAVIELEFDNHSLSNSSEKVSGAHELEPGNVPGGALNSDAAKELATAFATRGGEPADQMTLSRALADLPKPDAPAPAPPKTSPPAASPATQRHQRDATKRLRCVQNAQGDMTKLQKCAESQ